jgi:hypothetical protein
MLQPLRRYLQLRNQLIVYFKIGLFSMLNIYSAFKLGMRHLRYIVHIYTK